MPTSPIRAVTRSRCTARVPGLGSAIFLHVGTGGPTAGCVSLPASQVVALLRWLRPAANPRITITG